MICCLGEDGEEIQRSACRTARGVSEQVLSRRGDERVRTTSFLAKWVAKVYRDTGGVDPVPLGVISVAALHTRQKKKRQKTTLEIRV